MTTWSPGATPVTPGPDGRDDAGALVPADDRVPPAGVGVPQVLVGVAEAGVGHLDQHLARPGVEHLELDDLVLGLRPAQHRCSRPHGVALARSSAAHAAWARTSGHPSIRAGRAACGTIGGCLPSLRPSRPRPVPAAAPSWSRLADVGAAAPRRLRRPAPGCSRSRCAACARRRAPTRRRPRRSGCADAAYDAQHADPARRRTGCGRALDDASGSSAVAGARPPAAWRTTIADVAADLDVIDLTVLVEAWARSRARGLGGRRGYSASNETGSVRRPAANTFRGYAATVGELTDRRARKKAQTRELIRVGRAAAASTSGASTP